MSNDNIPKYYLNKIQEAKDKQFEILDISYYTYYEKTRNAWVNFFSSVLFDQDKRLTKIPEEVFELKHIKILNLWGNQITSIPESIGNLSNLEELNLTENQLTSIPESIGNLSNLKKLCLWKNKLTSIPESISNLSNLEELDLSDNQLTSLPISIGKLVNLEELNLTENQLTSLPVSIGDLSNLKTLYLWRHQLESFRVYLGISSESKLNLPENPLTIPPIEVGNQGIDSIKEYFQQLKESGKDYIYEAKLLIVGEPGTGKTSFAKKIQDSQYQLQANQPSTEGIDVTKWSFSLDNDQEFKVNIWDFGGQAIYHATHQFFLTKRSLYTLVADSRKEDTDFYYWLNVVEQFSDNSPLLIIKNEKQERQREINELALRGQFTNLEKILATNLATNRGLDEIITNIHNYIKQLPQIGQVLPKTWVKVRNFLEKDERDYISLTEFREICQNNELTRHDDQLQLSRYLHDLGVCLHFQDEEDSLLYRTVILKPEWGTDAVYKVLDSKQVVDNHGCFNRNDLKNIWQELQYASRRGELLELMKKFQLCYEIPSAKDTFIAPQLLNDKQLEYDWNPSRNLILRYTYSDFMPKGIVSRFIVVMHQYIDQQQYVWKTGVVLNKDDTKAEVIEYYGKREIKIRIAGKHKRELLNNVTYELDKIHDSYKRLKYSKLMPCNCHQCKDSQSPYFYPFDRLRQFIADKQYNIQCQQSYQMVNVLSLIDDVTDFKKLIPDAQPRNNQPINIEQFNSISGDVKELLRKIGIDQGNYNERIERDYIDQSRRVNISDNATVNASGASAFNLGDISDTVTNTINQLPSFDNEPDKQELKELLIQLEMAVLETDLDQEEKEETIEQIQAIASSLTNSQDSTVKKTAKRAMKVLVGTAAILEAKRGLPLNRRRRLAVR